MKRPFLGCILFALPLLAFVACGDESVVNSNNVKQIAADDEAQDDADSKDSDTPVSSGKQSSKSSSSEKSSEKSSSSVKAETSDSDIVASENDLPKCSLKREGMEVYVKDEKTLYTCEDGEWTPEKDAPKDSKKSSSSEADATPKSSSSVIYIDVDFSSSSEKDPVVIVDKPTSSATIIDVPWEPGLSSSEVAIVTNLGSCKPATSPISKGTAVAWTFTPNPDLPKEMLIKFAYKDAYAWDFGGLTDDGSGSGRTSGKVTYTTSGKYTASVTVTIDGSAETKVCSELEVNGAPITGCKCTADASGAVDYLETPTVTWSVTGCTSVGATVNSYAWNGVAGAEATYAHTFAAATAAYAPTLKVANDDNTEIDVECTAVKVTEGPEYILKDNTTAFDITVGSYLMIYGCETSQYHQTPVVINASREAMEVTVNGKRYSIPQYGLAQVFSSQTPNEAIMVEVTSGSGKIQCQ